MKICHIRKLKIIGLALFLLCLAGGLSLLAVFLVREHHRAVKLEKAVRIFESGDYVAAKKLLRQVIVNDPNQERAYVCLAQIAQKEGNWQQEAKYWLTAERLNALMPDYRQNYKKALAMERNFDRLLTQCFNVSEPRFPMSDEDSFLYLLAAIRSNSHRDISPYWKLLENKKADFLNTEYGKLIRIITVSPPTAEMEKELDELAKSANPIVAFEALLQIAGMNQQRKNKFMEIEQALIAAAAINPFCGRPILTAFYIRNYQFDRAIEVGKKDWGTFHRPITALNLGELYLLIGNQEALASLQKNYIRGNKSEILTGFYLESLQHLAANNPDALVKSWEQTQNLFRSPVAVFVLLYYSIAKDDPPQVEKAWTRLQHDSPFYDLPQRAETILFAYIRNLLAQERGEDAAALLSMYNVPKFKDPLFARCYILNHYLKRTLRATDLTSALQAFPDDLVLLQCAVEYYYHTKDFSRSMSHVNHALKLNPSPDSGIHYYRIQNLIRLKRLNEAEQLFFAAVSSRTQDQSLLASYCEFCVAHQRTGGLEKLLALMRNEPSDGGRHTLLPYVAGELLLLQNQTVAGLEQFQKAETNQIKILFRMADRLGTYDCYEPAIRIYNKLLANVGAASYRPYVQANLAELYFATNRKKEALDLAEQAWRAASDNREIQQCFAHKLLDDGNSERALAVIADSAYQDRQATELKKLWIAAATREIPRLFDAHRRFDAERLCNQLLRYEPQSPLALEYLQKLNPPFQEEKTK